MTTTSAGVVAAGVTNAGSFSDRHFKYVLIFPAVFIILLIGLFPLVYSLIVSFQKVTMLVEDTAGKLTRCVARRTLGSIVCGDHVSWQPSGEQEGVITAIYICGRYGPPPVARILVVGRERGGVVGVACFYVSH